MNLDIILTLLYKNQLQDVVTRAIQLESNIPFKYNMEEQVVVELFNKDIEKVGMKFTAKSSYGGFLCTIVGIDKYDLNKPYIIRMPDGSVKKFSETDINAREVATVEPLPVVVDAASEEAKYIH
jgi:hypothetical protein